MSEGKGKEKGKPQKTHSQPHSRYGKFAVTAFAFFITGVYFMVEERRKKVGRGCIYALGFTAEAGRGL